MDPQSPTLGPASAAPVVRIAGVDKVFTSGTAVTTALKGIDLEIRRGEFISLIGPSGCGKSTLLRVIGDLVAPTAGTVEVNGKPAARARLDRDYGMVFQAPVLFDWRSVEDNVKLPLELMGYDGARRTARAKEMLDLVELSEFTRHRPYQLSGGMQQRVAIARALAFEPSILLMDEPFGALDEMTRERMNQEVLRIWEQTGITVVFVTHSIPEAVFLSSRVVVMSARPGRITDVIEVDLPRPRGVETREERRYFELVTAVREALRRGDVGRDRGGRERGHPGDAGLARPGQGRRAGSGERRSGGPGSARRDPTPSRSLAAPDRLLLAGDRRLRGGGRRLGGRRPERRDPRLPAPGTDPDRERARRELGKLGAGRSRRQRRRPSSRHSADSSSARQQASSSHS